MKLTLGFSPCPNDTFIFDALVNKKIDTEGLEFDFFLSDVEELNRWAFQSKLNITKLSFNAFTKCVSRYALLDSGAALGRGCGPLLIKNPTTNLTLDSKIAIPGKYTTANLLFSIFKPEYNNKFELLFSDIESSVLSKKFDAGLIIHENRFTYHEKGLEKVIDLGEFWENKTGLPIPLGGIVIDRNLPYEVQKRFEKILRKSIEYGLSNRSSSIDFVKSHAQEMEIGVINSHINLYVNDYTVSLGETGRKSVELIFEKTFGLGFSHDIFV